jgi:hypothetical protein
MRYLLMAGLLAISSVAWADETSDSPDVLEKPSNATTGAQRLGGPEINSPPHMSTGVGQSPNNVTRDDIARQQAAEATRRARHQNEAAGQPYAYPSQEK